MFHNNSTTVTTDSDPPSFEHIDRHFMVISIVIATIGIIGNGLVVWTVVRVRRLRTPMYCSASSLAATDALSLVFGPLSIASNLGYYGLRYWTHNIVTCYTVEYLSSLLLTSSICHIVLISFERYIAVVFPLKARSLLTTTRTLVIVVVIYAISAVTNAPIITMHHYRDDHVCDFDWLYPWHETYDVIAIILKTTVPLAALLFFNVSIAAVILAGARRRRTLTDADRDKKNDTADPETLRAVGMMGIVIVFFVVLIFPFQIAVLLVLFNVFTFGAWGFETAVYLIWGGRICMYINAAINPIVYAAVSPSFRTGIAQSFRIGRAPARTFSRTGTTNVNY